MCYCYKKPAEEAVTRINIRKLFEVCVSDFVKKQFPGNRFSQEIILITSLYSICFKSCQLLSFCFFVLLRVLEFMDRKRRRWRVSWMQAWTNVSPVWATNELCTITILLLFELKVVLSLFVHKIDHWRDLLTAW